MLINNINEEEDQQNISLNIFIIDKRVHKLLLKRVYEIMMLHLLQKKQHHIDFFALTKQ